MKLPELWDTIRTFFPQLLAWFQQAQRSPSGALIRVIADEYRRINNMGADRAALQAVLDTRAPTPWGYAWAMESREYAKVRLASLAPLPPSPSARF